jgi:hypothetical protein
MLLEKIGYILYLWVASLVMKDMHIDTDFAPACGWGKGCSGLCSEMTENEICWPLS